MTTIPDTPKLKGKVPFIPDIPDKIAKVLPPSPEEKIKKLIRDEVEKLTLFEFSYRPKHRVQKDLVMGADLQEVKSRCINFCNRHNIIFVYVRPACLNLDSGLRNYSGEQVKVSEPAV